MCRRCGLRTKPKWRASRRTTRPYGHRYKWPAWHKQSLDVCRWVRVCCVTAGADGSKGMRQASKRLHEHLKSAVGVGGAHCRESSATMLICIIFSSIFKNTLCGFGTQAFAAHIRFCANKMQLGVNFLPNTPNYDRVVEMQVSCRVAAMV